MEGSTLTSVRPIVRSGVSDKDIDYDEARKALQDFWEKCEDCYVFGKNKPVDGDINLLEHVEA